MRKVLSAFVLPFLCAALVFAQQAMNNDSVIKLIKAGLSDDIIVSTINSSPAAYDTSVDGLIALKTAGATNKVISAILLKSSGATAPPAAGPSQPSTPVSTVQEPEVMGKVFFLNPSTQTVQQLPGEQWKRQVKAGFSSTKTVDVVAGEHSSFRISSKDKAVFVFKPFPDKFNAIEGIKLYPFEVKDGKRTCIVAEQKGRSSEGNPGVIPLEATKYGASSYSLSPAGAHLSPGEYWIFVPGSGGYNDPLITFGVD